MAGYHRDPIEGFKLIKTVPNHLLAPNRPVCDKYKNMPNEEIKADSVANSLPYAVCGEHFSGDGNFGTIVRSANGFGAREVFYLSGSSKIDRRSMVGAYHYIDVNHLAKYDDFLALKDKYTFVGLDCYPGAVSYVDFDWWSLPKPPMIILGEEGDGITTSTLSEIDHLVMIPMQGTIRSLNVAVAAGIIMADIHRKYQVKQM